MQSRQLARHLLEEHFGSTVATVGVQVLKGHRALKDLVRELPAFDEAMVGATAVAAAARTAPPPSPLPSLTLTPQVKKALTVLHLHALVQAVERPDRNVDGSLRGIFYRGSVERMLQLDHLPRVLVATQARFGLIGLALVQVLLTYGRGRFVCLPPASPLLPRCSRAHNKLLAHTATTAHPLAEHFGGQGSGDGRCRVCALTAARHHAGLYRQLIRFSLRHLHRQGPRCGGQHAARHDRPTLCALLPGRLWRVHARPGRYVPPPRSHSHCTVPISKPTSSAQHMPRQKMRMLLPCQVGFFFFALVVAAGHRSPLPPFSPCRPPIGDLRKRRVRAVLSEGKRKKPKKKPKDEDEEERVGPRYYIYMLLLSPASSALDSYPVCCRHHTTIAGGCDDAPLHAQHPAIHPLLPQRGWKEGRLHLMPAFANPPPKIPLPPSGCARTPNRSSAASLGRPSSTCSA